MGARPMARVIQEHIKRPLAEELLFGKLTEGGHVRIDVAAAPGEGLILIAEPALRELEHLPQPADGNGASRAHRRSEGDARRKNESAPRSGEARDPELADHSKPDQEN